MAKTFKNLMESKEPEVILEYLTADQRHTFSKFKIIPAARQATDHFFGENNDVVREDVPDYDHDKSEVHKAVEHHLGHEISIEHYRSGVTKDKHDRVAKIGKMIKDEGLRNKFASDSTRSGSKRVGKVHASIVRGTEVAGQTNSKPDEHHPLGHAWAQESCKNIENGMYKSTLPREIEHGTVVHRVHDQNGTEIYRSTLHPYHNDKGHTAYAVNGEYGIKHPAFTAHAHDIAKRLSGPHKGGNLLYRINKHVYDDNPETDTIVHPNAKKDQIDRMIEFGQHEHQEKAIKHSLATKEQVEAALKNTKLHKNVRAAIYKSHHINLAHLTHGIHNEIYPEVRAVIAAHPDLPKDENGFRKALKDQSAFVREKAAGNKNATAEHLKSVIDPRKENHQDVRAAAAINPNAGEENITKAQNDPEIFVRHSAVRNPKANKNHIMRGLTDSDNHVRLAASRHHNNDSDTINYALDSARFSPQTRLNAINNEKASKENINKALDDDSENVRESAAAHPNGGKEEIDKAQRDKNIYVRTAALSNPNLTKEHHQFALSDSNEYVRRHAVTHPKTTLDQARHMEANDPDPDVKKAAKTTRVALEKKAKALTKTKITKVVESANRNVLEDAGGGGQVLVAPWAL